MQESKKTFDQKWSISALYVPSSLEKKRAILMYLFFGIVVFVNKKEMSIFEYFHLRQSLWWSVLFALFVVFSIVLMFLPFIKYIWLLFVLFMIWFWIMFVVKSRNGKYDVWWWEKSPLALFKWIGEWIMNLFEINIKVYPDVNDSLEEISSLEDLIK